MPRTVEERIVAEAVHDRGFRAALLCDPKAAIRARFGFELPDHVRLQVFEKPTPDTVVLVLPPELAEAGPTEAPAGLLSVNSKLATLGDLSCDTETKIGTCFSTSSYPAAGDSSNE